MACLWEGELDYYGDRCLYFDDHYTVSKLPSGWKE